MRSDRLGPVASAISCVALPFSIVKFVVVVVERKVEDGGGVDVRCGQLPGEKLGIQHAQGTKSRAPSFSSLSFLQES